MNSKIVAIALFSCLILSGCAKDTPQKQASCVEQPTQTLEYADEYSAIFDKIKTMNNDSAELVSIYDAAWTKFQYTISDSNSLSFISDLFSYAIDFDPNKRGIDTYTKEWKDKITMALCPSSVIVSESGYISAAGRDNEVNAAGTKYQNLLKTIPQANEEINEAIKQLRINYPDKTTDTEKLHNYYIESADLAEFAAVPTSPTIDKYKDAYDSLTEKVNEAEKHADLY